MTSFSASILATLENDQARFYQKLQDARRALAYVKSKTERAVDHYERILGELSRSADESVSIQVLETTAESMALEEIVEEIVADASLGVEANWEEAEEHPY